MLDVCLRGIVWLDMPLYGQAVQNLDAEGVRTLLRTLDSKLIIDNLLVIKDEAQCLQVLEQP